MIGHGLVILGIGVTVVTLLGVCGIGPRTSGHSWFDIPHNTGRTARRRNR